MRHEFLLLSAASLALTLVACKPAASVDSEESSLAESESSATQDTLDVSEASAATASFAPSSSNAVAGCTVTRDVLATATACSQSYDSSVKVSWSCTGPNGGTAQGTANVATAVVPDACPPSTYAISQTIGLDRTRTHGEYSGNLTGTSVVSWNVAPAAQVATKQVSLQLEHKVTKNGNLVRHQTLDGAKTVDLAGNGAGPADDTRTVNGSVDVKFLLAGDELNVTESNLVWHRDCCYPLAGSLSFVKSGNATGEGSITFGPSCGEAVNAQGDSLNLADCN